MKNNKFNLVFAVLYLVGGSSFILSAIFHTVTLSKGLFSVAGLCLLINSITSFITYVRNKKSEKHTSRHAESLE